MQIMERNMHLPLLAPLSFVEVFPSCDRTKPQQLSWWDFPNSQSQTALAQEVQELCLAELVRNFCVFSKCSSL